MANALERVHEPEAKSMGGKTKRISVLLQNQSAISNGFVTLAPWRSEFYGMPPQDYNFIGTNDWMNLLAAHEYRHMVQYTRSITGINKFIYYLFGQNGLAVTSFVSAPLWFWEGDAVATETAFTNSGRGRIPYFDLLLRTNLQEGRTFNYNKQYLRSYKHNISDHYVLGYHMVSYLRKKTGQADIWERIAKRAWRTPYIPFTFSRAIKKEAGMNVRQLYREMATDYRSEWSNERGSEATAGETINPRNSGAYTDYLYPQAQPDGSVIAWKRGIGDVDELVVLRDGDEQRLHTLGPPNSSGQLSAVADKIVWNEYRYDPRWQVRSYSVVMKYDLKDGKARQLTANSRYASAVLSPDGNRIATVETTTNYETRLTILDSSTGEVVKQFDNAANDAISMPRWVDDNRVAALRTANNLKTIAIYDLSSGNSSDVFQPTAESVGHPVPIENFVLYNSPVTGVDNIFAIDLTSGQRFQVTSAAYGAFNPNVSPDGQWLYFNNQTRDGFDVVRIPFDRNSWKPVASTAVDNATAKVLTEQEGGQNLFASSVDKDFAMRPYRKGAHMLNFHSWGAYTTSSLSSVNLGIYSRDLLNTTSIEAGYQLDVSERTGAWNATISYQGFYPIIDLTVSQGNRKSTREIVENNEIIPATYTWTEQTVKPSLRIPLLLTRSRFNTTLIVKNAVALTRVSGFTNETLGTPNRFFLDQQPNGTLLTDEFGFEFTNLMRRSRRDFLSKWGQRLEIKSIGALTGSDFTARTTAAIGYLFFPGVFKHHSIYTIGAYQNMKITFYPENYLLRNQIPRPRGGFLSPAFENFYFGSVNYSMPVWYPDIALGPFINFQRVRANFYYDYGFGDTYVVNTARSSINSNTFISTGVEVRFDGNFMRLLGQFDLGFRYSYRITDQAPFFELIFGSFGF